MTDRNGIERDVEFIVHATDPERAISRQTLEEAMAKVSVQGYPVELTRLDKTSVYGVLGGEVINDETLGDSVIMQVHSGSTKVPLNTIHKLAAFGADKTS
jgi:hypothetical protein